MSKKEKDKEADNPNAISLNQGTGEVDQYPVRTYHRQKSKKKKTDGNVITP